MPNSRLRLSHLERQKVRLANATSPGSGVRRKSTVLPSSDDDSVLRELIGIAGFIVAVVIAAAVVALAFCC